MRRFLSLASLVAIAASACQVAPIVKAPTPSDRPVVKGSANTSSADPLPTALASSMGSQGLASPVANASPPVPGTSASPALGPNPGQGLVRPPGDVREVSGVISIDAAYAVSVGSGQIIVNNTSRAIAVGENGVISNSGGQLMSDSGSLLLSNNGGNLISDAGGSAISDHGAGLMSDSGSLFRLLGVPEGPAVTAFGTILPAAGMPLRVRSLRTNKDLTLGLDGAGKPVYEVLSRLDGSYKLFVPKETTDNVLVEARLPRQTNARLAYSLVDSPRTKALLNEDTHHVTVYLREAMIGTILESLISDKPQISSLPGLNNLGPRLQEVAQRFGRMRDAAVRGNFAGLSVGSQRYVVQRAVDVLLSVMNLEEANTEHKGFGKKEEPAMPVLERFLKKSRQFVSLRMEEMRQQGKDPTDYYAKRPYMVEINRRRKALGVPLFEIRKPADFNDLLGYISKAELNRSTEEINAELATVVASGDSGLTNEDVDLKQAAQAGITKQYIAVLYLRDIATLDAMVAAIETSIVEQRAAP